MREYCSACATSSLGGHTNLDLCARGDDGRGSSAAIAFAECRRRSRNFSGSTRRCAKGDNPAPTNSHQTVLPPGFRSIGLDPWRLDRLDLPTYASTRPVVVVRRERNMSVEPLDSAHRGIEAFDSETDFVLNRRCSFRCLMRRCSSKQDAVCRESMTLRRRPTCRDNLRSHAPSIR